jgi:predicted Fe-Mo cluster-binding NifX family protein
VESDLYDVVAARAILINSEVSNHFADMAQFQIVKLREGSVDLAVPFNDSAMSRQTNAGAFSAIVQHSLNIVVSHRG